MSEPTSDAAPACVTTLAAAGAAQKSTASYQSGRG